MDMLRLYSLQDMKACPLDKWGILDPGTGRRDAEGERENGTFSHANALENSIELTPSNVSSVAGLGSHPDSRRGVRCGLQPGTYTFMVCSVVRAGRREAERDSEVLQAHFTSSGGARHTTTAFSPSIPRAGSRPFSVRRPAHSVCLDMHTSSMLMAQSPLPYHVSFSRRANPCRRRHTTFSWTACSRLKV